MRLALCSMAFVGLALIALPAARAADEPVITKMTAKIVVELLEEEGYKKPQFFPPMKEGDPEIVSLKAEGRQVLLFIPSTGVSVQGHYATKEVMVDLKKVNDWNRNSYFTK